MVHNYYMGGKDKIQARRKHKSSIILMLRYYILIFKILVDRRENIKAEERWGNGGQREMVWWGSWHRCGCRCGPCRQNDERGYTFGMSFLFLNLILLDDHILKASQLHRHTPCVCKDIYWFSKHHKKSNSYFFKAIIYACVYYVCWGGVMQTASVQSEIGGQLSRVSSLFPSSRGRVSIIVSATGLLTQGRRPISLQAILISHCTSPRIMDVCYIISFFMWVLEIDLRPLGLHSKCFYPRSHLDGPCNYIFTDL